MWHYPTRAERDGLLTYANVRTDRGVFEAATAATWSVKTQLRNVAGTVLAQTAAGVVADPAAFDKTTGVYTGSVADKLLGILAFDRVLTAAEIAAFN